MMNDKCEWPGSRVAFQGRRTYVYLKVICRTVVMADIEELVDLMCSLASIQSCKIGPEQAEHEAEVCQF